MRTYLERDPPLLKRKKFFVLQSTWDHIALKQIRWAARWRWGKGPDFGPRGPGFESHTGWRFWVIVPTFEVVQASGAERKLCASLHKKAQ